MTSFPVAVVHNVLHAIYAKAYTVYILAQSDENVKREDDFY